MIHSMLIRLLAKRPDPRFFPAVDPRGCPGTLPEFPGSPGRVRVWQATGYAWKESWTPKDGLGQVVVTATWPQGPFGEPAVERKTIGLKK